MNPDTLKLEAIEMQTGPAPAACVVVLHGLGADGNDFVPIVHQLDLSAAGNVRYIFPNAPIRPVTVNGGMRMRAWYDVAGFGPGFAEDEAGLRASGAAVRALLEREFARGMAPERTVLMGFSQGCAMTLLTGLRLQVRLAGLVGLSGYLPLAGSAAAEAGAQVAGLPVFLGHGTQDPVVNIERCRAGRDAVRNLGADVRWHEYPMAHSVCPQEVGDLQAFLRTVLAR
jgi:phospholipase/carboxylesterase